MIGFSFIETICGYWYNLVHQLISCSLMLPSLVLLYNEGANLDACSEFKSRVFTRTCVVQEISLRLTTLISLMS